ncbi:HAD-IA family hydrolase [Candidatus Pacearchaeota archaeon]|nr:HAD-IA family hydrolase [Candidatus Pacearchaeota archaeon]
MVEEKKHEHEEAEEKKIILVDAVHCLVDEEGNVNEKMKNYLDSLENKKIILTNAPKEKHKIFFKHIKDYEIFTLENNPSKKDPEYYKKFLEKFKLNSKNAVYFEHDEDSIKSAKSVGINTVLYKNNLEEIKDFINKNIKSKEKIEEEKTETKKHAEKKQKEIKKPKKEIAMVNALSLHMSTKTAAAISKFIKGKEIQKAINELEEVARIKKPIPMKGEYPHRKGKIMSGRFPQKAAKNFIKLLKSLSANANFLGVENPRISEAISNIAPRPYGKFGSVRRKRTHVRLIARRHGENKLKNKMVAE